MNTNQNIGTPSDLNSDRVAMEAGSPGTDYAAATWTDPDFEESIEDERLRNLMQWASDVHRNSELEQAAGSATPNIDDLVLMVGDEGGSR